MSFRSRTRAPAQALAIHIGVVTLEGITMTPDQVRQFQGALQAEVRRLATQQDPPQRWSPAVVDAERAPRVVWAAPSRAAQLGVEVGRSLWNAIGGGGE
jgi:hypothetical protein